MKVIFLISFLILVFFPIVLLGQNEDEINTVPPSSFENATTTTQIKEVELPPTPDGVPRMKCALHMHNWGPDRKYGFTCSTAIYIGLAPVTSHYIDVFAGWISMRLEFNQFGQQSAFPDNRVFHAHKADLYHDFTFRTAQVNKVLRVAGAHMVYLPEEIGYSPTYGFTGDWTANLENRVIR